MSPFISIIESNFKTEIKGIYFSEHTKWASLKLKLFTEVLKKNKKSRFILEKPLWIQIIHGKNIGNTYDRGFPVLKTKALNSFGIDLTIQGQSILKIPKYYNYVIWKRYFKSLIVRNIIKRRYFFQT